MPKNQEIKFSMTYRVPTHIIYKTLTDQMETCRFTQGPSVVEPKPDGQYMIYDGMITGTFVSVEENAKIVQKWRMKDWPADVYSLVTMTFTGSDDSTELTIDQVEIPEYDTYGKFVHLDNLENGWKQMIFQRIEQVFGYPI